MLPPLQQKWLARCLPTFHLPGLRTPLPEHPPPQQHPALVETPPWIRELSLCLGLPWKAIGRLVRFVDWYGLSSPLLDHARNSKHCFGAIKAEHTSRVDQHLRLLVWCQRSTREHSQAKCFVHGPPSPIASFSGDRSTRACSAHVGGLPRLSGVSFVQAFVCKFSMGLVQDVPDHLKARPSNSSNSKMSTDSFALQLRREQKRNSRIGEAMETPQVTRLPAFSGQFPRGKLLSRRGNTQRWLSVDVFLSRARDVQRKALFVEEGVNLGPGRWGMFLF